MCSRLSISKGFDELLEISENETRNKHLTSFNYFKIKQSSSKEKTKLLQAICLEQKVSL